MPPAITVYAVPADLVRLRVQLALAAIGPGHRLSHAARDADPQPVGRLGLTRTHARDGEVDGDGDDANRLERELLTVIDATNVQPEARKPLVELARRYHVLPVVTVLDLPERSARRGTAIDPAATLVGT